MGKTKTKFIDDSASKPEPKKVVKDALVEKLKAELGMEDAIETKPQAQEANESKEETKPVKKVAPKKGKSKPRSKKYQEVSKDLDRTKSYPINEAIELAKKLSISKFDGTLEAHINTIQTIRGLISLPFVSGKKLRILVFGTSEAKIEDASGITYGDDSTIDSISKGKIDFDLLISTPNWMPKLAKAAKVLGPRGLMPNPKNGTIAQNEDSLKKTIESFQAGKTEYKTESKAPVIHLGLGKLSQPSDQLVANVKLLLMTIGKTKIKKVSLSPTMGPSVKVDLSSL